MFLILLHHVSKKRCTMLTWCSPKKWKVGSVNHGGGPAIGHKSWFYGYWNKDGWFYIRFLGLEFSWMS